LRVGGAWSVPGIYSEKGPVVVGAQNGNIWLNGKVGIGSAKKDPSQSLDVDGTVKAKSIDVDGAGTVTAGTLTAGSLTARASDKVVTISGPATIAGNNTLEFGAGVNKHVNSGKIGYQLFTADALDIVGAGTSDTTHKIKFWANGGATLNGSLTVDGQGGGNVDFIVNGRLRSNNNDGGLWVASDRFVGGHDTNKIGFWNNNAWRLAVRENGQVEVPGELFVRGRLVYWWGPDGAWKKLENRANDYAGSYSTSGPSDVRFKTALRPISNALEKVLQLNGTCYRWGEAGIRYFTRDFTDKFSAGPDATADDNQMLWDAERQKAYHALSGDKIGLLAQELETVVPELVHEDKEGYKYIQYPQLTALLVEAIKEQNAMIQSLSGRLAVLEAR
jgi:Chaperone of endosialidase